MQPIIGITSYLVKDFEMGVKRVRGLEGQDMAMTTYDYVNSIKMSGGYPLIIPVINDEVYISEILRKLDGVLFTGGPDITPYFYQDHPREGLGKTVPERDVFEMKLLEKALEQKKSILGICRGAQIINCYYRGTLYQDISTNNLSEINHAALMQPKHFFNHSIKIENSSILYEIFEKEEIFVNSFHHQCIKDLGEGLTKIALSEDNVVEGFEKTDYPFMLGVQWHPEMMTEKVEEQIKIFKYFIENTRRFS